MFTISRCCLWMTGTAVALALSGCDDSDASVQPSPVRPAHPVVVSSLKDEKLAPSQEQLLDAAFRIASLIPVKPHIKDRCLSQYEVFSTCLELKQPARAEGLIDKIGNWRRAAALADLAYYCVQNRIPCDVQRYLSDAALVSHDTEDWRRDQVKATIARTHALLGDDQLATRLEKGIKPHEKGKVSQVQASTVSEYQLASLVKQWDAAIANGEYDATRNALFAYAALFDRVYADKQQRAIIEGKIKSSWTRMPILVRLELLMDLADTALRHESKEHAVALVDEAYGVVNSHGWPATALTPLLSKLASLRFRAGDVARARTEVDAALAIYDKAREQIVNIDRAGALRPIAEAYQTLGNVSAALAVYKRAVEEGMENPNSRPRALDLAATCRSMATHAAEPDEALWKRIRQIEAGLGDPW